VNEDPKLLDIHHPVEQETPAPEVLTEETKEENEQ
jgi:hypothetical protein